MLVYLEFLLCLYEEDPKRRKISLPLYTHKNHGMISQGHQVEAMLGSSLGYNLLDPVQIH